MRRVELLLHQRVEAELRIVRGRHRKYVGAADTAIRKLMADPRGTGPPLRGITNPELQGNVRKLDVGGRRGYRLFYWVTPPRKDTGVDLVVPLFVSDEPRTRFDYDDVDVNVVGMDIVDDFRSGRFDRFTRFRDSGLLISFLTAEPKVS